MSMEETEPATRVVPTDVDEEQLRRVLELTGFQRDLVVVLARLAGTRPDGVTVRRTLDDVRGASITDARLYQNLRDLHDVGVVAKRPIDGRTNAYRLTDEATWGMWAYVDWAESCLNSPELARGERPGVVIRGGLHR
jgi:hypothetical protein